jgi:hypothetical protein
LFDGSFYDNDVLWCSTKAKEVNINPTNLKKESTTLWKIFKFGRCETGSGGGGKHFTYSDCIIHMENFPAIVKLQGEEIQIEADVKNIQKKFDEKITGLIKSYEFEVKITTSEEEIKNKTTFDKMDKLYGMLDTLGQELSKCSKNLKNECKNKAQNKHAFIVDDFETAFIDKSKLVSLNSYMRTRSTVVPEIIKLDDIEKQLNDLIDDKAEYFI